MMFGRTLLGDNLRDAMWALDYASTLPDARADRVGCVGLSYGGRMTMVVSALDPRIRVAVISGALNVFQERVQGSGYSCGAQVIPGLLRFRLDYLLARTPLTSSGVMCISGLPSF